MDYGSCPLSNLSSGCGLGRGNWSGGGAAATGTLFVQPRLAYDEVVCSYLLSMKSPNGGTGTFGRGHGDEPETAQATVGAIKRDIDLRDVAIRGKQIHQIPFRRNRGQVIYVDFGVHDV